MGSKSTGSKEHGTKKTREQGAKESNLGSREQKIQGIVSNLGGSDKENLGSGEQRGKFWRERGTEDPPLQSLNYLTFID